MSASFYPARTKAFDLPFHRHIEEGKRPRFYAKFLTRRTRSAIRVKLKEASDAEDAGNEAAAIAGMDEVIGQLLAGGDNLPEDFKPDQATDHLDIEDCWELITGALDAITATKEDMKKPAATPAATA